MKIGFIGVGVMGAPMVQNLMKKGHELSVYNRTKEKAAGVVAAGAKWCESAGACAKDQDVVITIVGYPKDVEEVYFAPGGILDSAAPGTVLCIERNRGILVKCKEGSIWFNEVHPAGKKPMAADAFANGRGLKPGDGAFRE